MTAKQDTVKKNGKLNFVLGCGGTGGHIYPALAIAQQLQSSGHHLTFIGNRGGMEETLIPQAGHQFVGIRMRKLYRKLSLANLLLPFFLVSSTIVCLRVLRRTKADAVICTGGFVSGPVGIAAALRKIPLYFHECNSYPGLTTRHLAKHARIVFTGFSGTAKHLPQARVREIGIPLLQKQEQPQTVMAGDLHLESSKPILLVTGGSQGSLAINNAVASALPGLLELGWQLIWQTGQTGHAEFSRRFPDSAGVHIFAFSPQLKEYYKLARVAVTRAGAMTITELMENHLPALLIPLPTAAENHQHYNALEQQNKGLALLLEQNGLTGETLLEAVTKLNAEHDKYLNNLRNLPRNTAAGDIAREILNDLCKEQQNAGKD